MVEGMKDNGKKIKCMEKVYINGLMVGNMMEVIQMIKNMVMECICGLMVEGTKENGKMVYKMGKVDTMNKMVPSKLEYGQREN